MTSTDRPPVTAHRNRAATFDSDVQRPAPAAGQSVSWAPTPKTTRRLLTSFAAGGALIGLVGFAVSFTFVSAAARPYLGREAWALPTLVDLSIFVLSGLALFLELCEVRSRWIRIVPNALAFYTLYLNIAEQHGWFGRAVHAAGPLLWVTVVEIGTFTVRRLVGLSDEARMQKVRASRWLLAPLATARLWRRMRLWEITDYRAALRREHERAACAALLKQWYGRTWRARAPRGERLAVKLQGATGESVADLLARASTAITAAAHAAAKPAEQNLHAANAEPVNQALRPLDPVLYPRGERAVLIPFTAQPIPFSQDVNGLTESASPAALGNATENDEDAAARMRGEGLSYGQIAARLGRSKTWAYQVVNGRPVEHANGSAV